MLPHRDLVDRLNRSNAVVLQGGPGGIMDARNAGVRPIVVPRDPQRGEHVDSHQLDFARHLDRLDLAWLATTREELFAHLDKILVEPCAMRGQMDDGLPTGVQTIMDEFRTPPARRRLRMRRMLPYR